jgi:hypothetical protein
VLGRQIPLRLTGVAAYAEKFFHRILLSGKTVNDPMG